MKIKITAIVSAIFIMSSCYHTPEEIALVPSDTTENQEAENETTSNAPYITDTIGVRYYAGTVYHHILTDYARALSTEPPWQIPSREDARAIRQHLIFGEERMLCYDDSTQTYYTFLRTGPITRAGEKTRYTLLTIRKDTLTTNIEIVFEPL